MFENRIYLQILEQAEIKFQALICEVWCELLIVYTCLSIFLCQTLLPLVS